MSWFSDDWCDYCKDNSSFWTTSYYCDLEKNKDIKDYVEEYCKHDYKVSYCPIYKKHKGSSSWCFITTVTCKILGKEDNDPVMEKLRYLRNNYIQKNPDYDMILKGYDTIGPVLAQKVLEDDKKMAEAIYECGLKPISKLVEEDKLEDATEKYYAMTLMLIKKYGLKKEYNKLMDNNFGFKEGEFIPEESGHGKVYKPIEN